MLSEKELWVIVKGLLSKVILGKIAGLSSSVIVQELILEADFLAPDILELEKTEKITEEMLTAWAIEFNLRSKDHIDEDLRVFLAKIYRANLENPSDELLEKIQDFEGSDSIDIFTEYIKELLQDDEN